MFLKTIKSLLFVFLATLLIQCNKDKRKTIVVGSYSDYKNIDTLTFFDVERIFFDVDLDGSQDTIILKDLEHTKGDPELYSFIEIRTSKRIYQIKKIYGYLIDSLASIEVKNEVPSDKIYFSKTISNKTIMIVWDYKYPDCTTNVGIFEFNQNDVNHVLSDNIVVKELIESKENNQLLIIGVDVCDDTKKEIVIK